MCVQRMAGSSLQSPGTGARMEWNRMGDSPSIGKKLVSVQMKFTGIASCPQTPPQVLSHIVRKRRWSRVELGYASTFRQMFTKVISVTFDLCLGPLHCIVLHCVVYVCPFVFACVCCNVGKVYEL